MALKNQRDASPPKAPSLRSSRSHFNISEHTSLMIKKLQKIYKDIIEEVIKEIK